MLRKYKFSLWQTAYQFKQPTSNQICLQKVYKLIFILLLIFQPSPIDVSNVEAMEGLQSQEKEGWKLQKKESEKKPPFPRFLVICFLFVTQERLQRQRGPKQYISVWLILVFLKHMKLYWPTTASIHFEITYI